MAAESEKNTKRKKGKKRKKVFRKLHRLLGFLLLVPLLIFTLSGVLLMHKSDFGIDQKRVKSEWVMAQYGLTFDEAPVAWSTGESMVAQWEGACVLGETAVEVEGDIISAVAVKNGVCVATDSAVYFFGWDRRLIEKLESGLSLPEGRVERVGVNEYGKLVMEYGGGIVFFLDDDLLDYVPLERGNDTVQWSQTRTLSAEQKAKVKAAIIGEGMPMDRVILDFHSGSIFKLLGKILVDAFALGILGLCFSGVAIYMRKRKREKKNEQGLDA